MVAITHLSFTVYRFLVEAPHVFFFFFGSSSSSLTSINSDDWDVDEVVVVDVELVFFLRVFKLVVVVEVFAVVVEV